MRTKIIMHQSTLEYFLKKYEKNNFLNHIQGGMVSLYGDEIIVDNFFCSETINEPDGYMFPKEKFVTYEPSDREWCEPVGIGRMGRGFKLGDIFFQDMSLFSRDISLFSFEQEIVESF
jgi:hypothetical protein